MASNPRIDDLRKRLEKEPNSRLFAQLAEELRKDGEFEEAIRIARAGLARHPSYPSARMTLGRALFDTGDMASARQELQSVLEGAPDNILASRLLAECLEGLGDLEGALKRYRATLALSPGDKLITAHVRELEGKLQSAARPSGAPSAAPAAEQAPIKVATVDEPMVLETSDERHAPAGEAAPVKVVESAPEFELETAYEAPGTQWRAPTAFEDPAVGERTLVDEPAPFVAPEPPAAAAPPEPTLQPPPVAEVMPPLPEPVTAAGSAAPPAAASPASEDVPLPPLPPVVAPAPQGAPPAATAAPDEGELVSPTLAELYFNQGFPEKAIQVYRGLLEREPANERARARVAELQAALSAPSGAAAPAGPPADSDHARAARRQALERTIERLESLRAALQKGAR